MSISNIISTIFATIQNFGTFQFIVVVVVDIVLWGIHPILGFIGALFIFALLVGLI